MSMLRFLSVVCVMQFTLLCFSQAPLWLEHYGSGGYNEGLILAGDDDGYVYGTGTIGSLGLVLDEDTASVLGEQDILLTKWDSSGHVLWAQTAGGDCDPSDFDAGSRIAFDPVSEHVIIAGRYDCPTTYFGSHIIEGSPESDAADMFVASYDSSGTCIWAKGVQGYRVGVRDVLVDATSNVFIVGMATLSGAEFQEPIPVTIPTGGFIAKYDADGELQQAESVLVSGSFSHSAWIASDEWILAGKYNSGATLFGQSMTISAPLGDGFVARADTTGTLIWSTSFISSTAAEVTECAVGANGKIAAAGYFLDSLFLDDDTLFGAEGEMSFFIAQLSSTGSVEWVQQVASNGQALVHDLKINAEGEILAFGRSDGGVTIGGASLSLVSSQDGFVLRLDDSGTCLSALNFGRIAFGNGSILPTSHGVYLSCDYDSAMVFGASVVPCHTTGSSDLFLARFDSIAGFSGISSMTLQNGGLIIYANPNNGLCTIELPDKLRLTNDLLLSIYSQSGQLVQRVPLQQTNGGVKLDIRAQAKGVYHVELGDGGQRYTGRIVFE